MTEQDHSQPTEIEMMLINQVATLYELTFGITTSILQLSPPQVDGTDLTQRKSLETLQNCLNTLGAILYNMGSDVVKPNEEPKSSIIIP